MAFRLFDLVQGLAVSGLLIPYETTGIRDQLASSAKAPLLRGVCV